MADPAPTADPSTRRPDASWPERYILVVLIGIGLIAFAQLFLLATAVSDIAGNVAIASVFSTLGGLGIGIGFALAGALGRTLTPGARIALLVAGAYFTTTGGAFSLLAQVGSLF